MVYDLVNIEANNNSSCNELKYFYVACAMRKIPF